MTEQANLLSMPYIMPSQAQKHATRNKALRMLDAMLHIAVETAAIDALPEEPAESERHLIGAAPSVRRLRRP